MDNPVKVFALGDDFEMLFDAGTVPKYAVAYAHITEDRKELTSAFFHAVHDKTLDEFYAKHNIVFTESGGSIACGNWAARK